MSATGPRALVIASFVALTLGALGGYWMGLHADGRSRESEEAPPHPVGVPEHVRLGMRALSQGDAAEAERRFRDAVALAPADPSVRANLAVALMIQERWGEAESELERAQTLGPDLPEVAFLQGVLARDGLGDPARARAAWERFLALVPATSPQADSIRQWIDALPVD